jgi:hypothetical protein
MFKVIGDQSIHCDSVKFSFIICVKSFKNPTYKTLHIKNESFSGGLGGILQDGNL